MTTKNLLATEYDNRGSSPDEIAADTTGKATAYGFVYFNDGRRVAYTSRAGVQGDATGGWQPVTDTHVRLATALLREHGVPLPA